MANFLKIRSSSRPTEYKGIMEKAYGGLHEYISKYVLDFVPKGSSILDLGSGTGAWVLRLADQGYKVTGCDLNPQNPQGSCLSVNLNEEFADKLGDFGSSSFNAITCIEVLEHLENPRNVLRQSRKLLPEGGKLILSTPNTSGLYSRIRFLFTGQFNAFDDLNYREIGHIRPITYWELKKMLEETNFSILKVSFYEVNTLIPRTLGDVIKKISWIIRPFMLGTVGTTCLVIIAEKK